MAGIKGRKPAPTGASSGWYAPDGVAIGSLLYVDANGLIKGLTPGAAAQVLTSNGVSPAIPSYQGAPGGGGGTPFYCKLTKSGNQALGNSAFGLVAVTWDTELADSDSLHSTSSNTSRITAAYAQPHAFLGNLRFSVSNVTYFQITIRKNGTTEINTVIHRDLDNNSFVHDVQIVGFDPNVSVGDYWELMAGGSDANRIVNAGDAFTNFSAWGMR